MKTCPLQSTASFHSAKSRAGRAQPLVLAIVFFVAGAVAARICTGIWLRQHHPSTDAGGLAAPTQNVLGQLPSLVTVRYYALLPAGSADPSIQAFARRVANLLDTMQAASGGKLRVTTLDQPAETNASAASADGIQAFNLDKGEACFLGVAVASGNHKESLTRLQPEWEPALEFDLARAIERATAVEPPRPPAPEVAKPRPEITSSIQELIPDVIGTSLEQADEIFHADFLKQCAIAGQEIEAKVNTAAEQVSRAQNNGSATDADAARKHLQEVQLAQGERLRALAARLQLQLAVFQQMKNAATNASK
jgi:hypothetical protein